MFVEEENRDKATEEWERRELTSAKYEMLSEMLTELKRPGREA